MGKVTLLKTAVIDIDGVILNMKKDYHQLALKLFGEKAERILQSEYHFAERLPDMSKKEVDHVWDRLPRDSHEMLEYADLAIQKLRETGHNIVYLTATEKHLQKHKVKSLQEHLIYQDADMLICTGQTQTKLAKLQEIKPDVFFDDLYSNICHAQCANVKHNFLILDTHSYDVPQVNKYQEKHHEADSLIKAVELYENMSSR